MFYLKQKRYDKFECLGPGCPESCCKGWQIMVDDESLRKYALMEKKDDRIRNSVDKEQRCFSQHEKICDFLDKDELCHLWRNYGEDSLCETCRTYPKHTEEFEGIREFSLSLSCPKEAAELISDEEKMTFIESEDDEDEEFEDFDYLLYDKLVSARELLFKIAQNRSIAIGTRMNMILETADSLQGLLDEDKLFEMDDLIDDWSDKVSADHSRTDKNSPKRIETAEEPDFDSEKRSFSVLFELEFLHDTWQQELDRTWEKVFSTPECFSDAQRFMENDPVPAEQILMFFIYTYFCGAVYDGWIFSKAAFAVYSVKWIYYMAYALYDETEQSNIRDHEGQENSGEKKTAASADNTNITASVYNKAEKNALIKATYRYARETEHSDINLDRLEEWFTNGK